jgi:hypothetical protein
VNLRKTAGLLAVAGLVVGLLGSGVGAIFYDQVTGTENIVVGTFDCQVTGVSDNGTKGSFDANSATYNAGTIMSSAPGSAPFTFTVQNFGTIPMVLSVSAPVWGGSPGLDGSFSGIAPVLSSATLAAGASATVTTGIQWTTLDNADLGTSGWARWTVACNEYPVTTTVTSSNLNYSNTGWGGWSCPAGTPNIWSAIYTGPGTLNVTLWQLGASVGAVNYPNTPFGYTYSSPTEEGAIAQATGVGGTYQLILQCY